MREYQLCVNQYAINYIGDVPTEVAKIVRLKDGKDVLKCFYDKSCYANTGYHICVRNDGNSFLDDSYKEILYKHTLVFEVIILHELGHIIRGHFRNPPLPGLDSEQLRKARGSGISKGFVSTAELEADAFAAKEVGKERVIAALDFLIRERRIRNDRHSALAIQEFELRKSYMMHSGLD